MYGQINKPGRQWIREEEQVDGYTEVVTMYDYTLQILIQESCRNGI